MTAAAFESRRFSRLRAFVAAEPALIVVCLIGVALRLAWLFQPIRYDEAVTYLAFVRPGVISLMTDYGLPNNHVFHSLLVYLSTRVSNDVWAIRLPAFIAGSLVPPVAFLVGRRLHGRDAALIGTALVACSVHLIEYSTNARGYSLVTLFGLMQILLADRMVRSARHREFAAYAIVTALGCFTVPTMLYPTAATCVWAAAVAIVERRATPWRKLATRVPAYALGGIALTVALYASILSQPHGVENLTSNRWVAPLTSIAGWQHAMRLLGGHFEEEWSLGLTSVGMAIVAILAIAGSIVDVVRRRDARPAWVLIASGVVIAILFVQRVAPFARVFCFALPMVLLAGGAGVAALARLANARRAMPALSLTLCVGLAAYVAIARLPDRAAAGDKFPAAAAVVAFLAPKVAAGDAVISGVVPSAPIQYVLLREGREPIVYRSGAARLWIVTRGDVSPVDVIKSRANRLPPSDFGEPRLAFERGIAQVYEVVPNAGRTPDEAKPSHVRRPATTQP